ncbi:MAG: hypothetical protein IBX47_09545 [Desulfuromonadales bacterium]|nr:hypothetical protein [Desulfuromonadales bacterium]
MSWTTPTDLRAQVQKLWDRGLLLTATFPRPGGKPVFPRRLTLKGPDSRQLSERFPEVREWINQLSVASGSYRIEWRSVNHRVLGSNAVPAEIWIDTLEDALGLIGKRRAAEQFATLVTLTAEKQPELLSWLAKRPLRGLQLAADWPRLLAIIAWLHRHPQPGIYLRQIDLPGVHSKFIEGQRGLLVELLDLVLPAESVDTSQAGVSRFCRRYGFLDKPLRVRLRILDQNFRLLQTTSDQDISLTQQAFAQLNLPISKVFITENEINFLAFPQVPEALVIFGAGYGFENLATANWLKDREIYYWGDIDTHGFAILNQLRGIFPKTTSFLMDRRTLLSHRDFWGDEAQPETRELARLNCEEATLYADLRQNRLGERLRLEQEKIGFAWVVEALAAI